MKLLKPWYLLFLLAFSIPLLANEKEITVAFVGDGIRNGEGQEFNPEILSKLLHQVRQKKPNALFYTGSLINGLEQKTNSESLRQFQSNLLTFSQIVKAYLGTEIPVYPVLGNHAMVNSQAVAMFREHFDLKEVIPLELNQLSYQVVIDDIQFLVLATGIHERKFPGHRGYRRTMPILDWIEKQLRTGPNIRYRFVVGHEPAFSSTGTHGVFAGIDKDEERRDQFWQVLKNTNTRAYFCSHEVLFDRSNRDGVWQVISGGAGTGGSPEDEKDMFFHYLLLTIPEGAEKNPVVKALDLDGKVWDDFKLMPTDRPVHQLRITHR